MIRARLGRLLRTLADRLDPPFADVHYQIIDDRTMRAFHGPSGLAATTSSPLATTRERDLAKQLLRARLLAVHLEKEADGLIWTGDSVTEPPRHVLAVRDSSGCVADRTPQECDVCKPLGSVWRWRHNGAADCWMDIDGIGPWVEVPGLHGPEEGRR